MSFSFSSDPRGLANPVQCAHSRPGPAALQLRALSTGGPVFFPPVASVSHDLRDVLRCGGDAGCRIGRTLPSDQLLGR